MFTELINQQPPQNEEFRRNNNFNNIISGKAQRIPTDVWKRYVPVELQGIPDVKRSLIQLPSNRFYGFFPMSRGTLKTAKQWIKPLAKTDVYNKKLHGLKVNDQEQNTQIQVMGVNREKAYTTTERFKDYAGNASGSWSRVKHAKSASKADSTNYIQSFTKMLSNNPLVIQARKSGAAYLKSAKKHRAF